MPKMLFSKRADVLPTSIEMVLPTGSRLVCVSSRGEGLSTPLASD